MNILPWWAGPVRLDGAPDNVKLFCRVDGLAVAIAATGHLVFLPTTSTKRFRDAVEGVSRCCLTGRRLSPPRINRARLLTTLADVDDRWALSPLAAHIAIARAAARVSPTLGAP